MFPEIYGGHFLLFFTCSSWRQVNLNLLFRRKFSSESGARTTKQSLTFSAVYWRVQSRNEVNWAGGIHV